jgi:ribosomal protein S18
MATHLPLPSLEKGGEERRRKEKGKEGGPSRRSTAKVTREEDATPIDYTDVAILPALPRLTTTSTRHRTTILPTSLPR